MLYLLTQDLSTDTWFKYMTQSEYLMTFKC